MKLIALCGAAGAGKDTVADMLPARKLAFADTLYREVAEAFGVTVEWLKDRSRKDVPQRELAQFRAFDHDFGDYLEGAIEGWWSDSEPRSPRQILQWWGDYRRAQDPDYFVRQTRVAAGRLLFEAQEPVIITDVRFPNEAAMVRQLGGQIWQIRRPGYEAGGTGHASDNDGSAFGPDRVIVNDGSRSALHTKVLRAWCAD